MNFIGKGVSSVWSLATSFIPGKDPNPTQNNENHSGEWVIVEGNNQGEKENIIKEANSDTSVSFSDSGVFFNDKDLSKVSLEESESKKIRPEPPERIPDAPNLDPTFLPSKGLPPKLNLLNGKIISEDYNSEVKSAIVKLTARVENLPNYLPPDYDPLAPSNNTLPSTLPEFNHVLPSTDEYKSLVLEVESLNLKLPPPQILPEQQLPFVPVDTNNTNSKDRIEKVNSDREESSSEDPLFDAPNYDPIPPNKKNHLANRIVIVENDYEPKQKRGNITNELVSSSRNANVPSDLPPSLSHAELKPEQHPEHSNATANISKEFTSPKNINPFSDLPDAESKQEQPSNLPGYKFIRRDGLTTLAICDRDMYSSLPVIECFENSDLPLQPFEKDPIVPLPEPISNLPPKPIARYLSEKHLAFLNDDQIHLYRTDRIYAEYINNPFFHPEQKRPIYDFSAGTKEPKVIDLPDPNREILKEKSPYSQLSKTHDPSDLHNKVFIYFPPLSTKPLNLKEQMLDTLKTYVRNCQRGFNPTDISLDHPIHMTLKAIVSELMKPEKKSSFLSWSNKELTLPEKIQRCEQALSEIVFYCIEGNVFPGIHEGDKVIPGFEKEQYREVLKSGKKIAPSGPSDNKWELLEIALRHHFLAALLDQEKDKLSFGKKAFSEDASQTCNTLYQFVTNNEKYKFDFIKIYEELIDFNDVVEKALSHCQKECPSTLERIIHFEKVINSLREICKIEHQLEGADGWVSIEPLTHQNWHHVEVSLREQFLKSMIEQENSRITDDFERRQKLPENFDVICELLHEFMTRGDKTFKISEIYNGLCAGIDIEGASLEFVKSTFCEVHLSHLIANVELEKLCKKFNKRILGKLNNQAAELGHPEQYFERRLRKLFSKLLSLKYIERLQWLFAEVSNYFPTKEVFLRDIDLLTEFICKVDPSREPVKFNLLKSQIERNVLKSTFKSLQNIHNLSKAATPDQLNALKWVTEEWSRLFPKDKIVEVSEVALVEELFELQEEIVVESIPYVRVYKPTDTDIPLVSYVNLVFKDHLNEALYDSLPETVRMDALRHVMVTTKDIGKAEEIAAKRFKQMDNIESEFKRLEKQKRTLVRKHLDENFIRHGEKVLRMYYSSQRNYDAFLAQFKTLPYEKLFFQYVYEMAKEAGVEIPEWDLNFADNNWHKPGMIGLSIQALERCLHTHNAPVVVYYKGEGELFIRGEGPGMSWDQGIKLENVGDGTFILDAQYAAYPFKVLLNDQQWMQGDNAVAKEGKTSHIWPRF